MDDVSKTQSADPLLDAVDTVLEWFPDELPQHAVSPVGFMTALSRLREVRESLETE